MDESAAGVEQSSATEHQAQPPKEPEPEPEPKAKPKQSRKSRKDRKEKPKRDLLLEYDETKLFVPDNFGQQHRRAFAEYVSYKAKSGHANLLVSYQKTLEKWALDPDGLVFWMDYVIERGWQGLQPNMRPGEPLPDSSGGQKSQKKNNLERTMEVLKKDLPDWAKEMERFA